MHDILALPSSALPNRQSFNLDSYPAIPRWNALSVLSIQLQQLLREQQSLPVCGVDGSNIPGGVRSLQPA
jgi:hypothetical protein